MSLKIEFSSLEELPNVAKQIIDFAGQAKIWLFEGAMAAGKTTLITQICKQLGVHDHISSPTYSLVNEYENGQHQLIYHFDFYRLKTEMEAVDYGIYDYFESGNLCLCEWPSKIPNLLPYQYLMVNLTVTANHTRIASLELVG